MWGAHTCTPVLCQHTHPHIFSKQNSKEEKLFYILKIVKLKKKYERPYLAVIYARNHSTFLNFWRICLHKNRTRARMEMCAHANSLLWTETYKSPVWRGSSPHSEKNFSLRNIFTWFTDPLNLKKKSCWTTLVITNY